MAYPRHAKPAAGRTVRGTTGSYWVEGKNTKMPWGWGRLSALAALPLLGLTAGISTPWAVGHIEDELVAEARADLDAAGIDHTSLDIDFDYRDGEATGVLPAGVDAEAAEGAVDDGLLRDFDVRADTTPVAQPPAPQPTPTPTPAATPTAVPTAGAEASADAMTGAPPDPPIDAEVVALQAELDGLAAEIQETVVFAFGSEELSADATATLDKVVAAMEQYPLPVVEVAGHTDNRGPADLNRTLSQARDDAVAAYLRTQGIGAERLSARGAGDTEPIDTNDTDDGRARNRRVALTALDTF